MFSNSQISKTQTDTQSGTEKNYLELWGLDLPLTGIFFFGTPLSPALWVSSSLASSWGLASLTILSRCPFYSQVLDKFL